YGTIAAAQTASIVAKAHVANDQVANVRRTGRNAAACVGFAETLSIYSLFYWRTRHEQVYRYHAEGRTARASRGHARARLELRVGAEERHSPAVRLTGGA